VVHRAREDVELVVQLVERRLRDDELALAEVELACPLPRHPVPLPASLRAELAGPPATAPLREHPSAPPTALQFRHDESVADLTPPLVPLASPGGQRSSDPKKSTTSIAPLRVAVLSGVVPSHGATQRRSAPLPSR